MFRTLHSRIYHIFYLVYNFSYNYNFSNLFYTAFYNTFIQYGTKMKLISALQMLPIRNLINYKEHLKAYMMFTYQISH